jgi:transcriptional regulator with XRE-family HTH domain
MGMADIKKKFGVRLFQLRSEAGMTQAELAEKANLSIDSISRIERGDRSPSFESLERIAAALKTDPVQLLNFERKEIQDLAECPAEVLELWKLLRKKKPHQIKKLFEMAKILLDG